MIIIIIRQIIMIVIIIIVIIITTRRDHVMKARRGYDTSEDATIETRNKQFGF